MKKRTLKPGMTQALSTKIYRLVEKIKKSYGPQEDSIFYPCSGEEARVRKDLEECFVRYCEYNGKYDFLEMDESEKNECMKKFETQYEEFDRITTGQSQPIDVEELCEFILNTVFDPLKS